MAGARVRVIGISWNLFKVKSQTCINSDYSWIIIIRTISNSTNCRNTYTNRSVNLDYHLNLNLYKLKQ